MTIRSLLAAIRRRMAPGFAIEDLDDHLRDDVGLPPARMVLRLTPLVHAFRN